MAAVHVWVVFTRVSQEARSQRAWYDAGKRLLILKESPEVTDGVQGSRLRAQAIDVNTETQDISARHNVRHEVKRQTETRGLLGAKGETMVFTSPFLEYQAKSRSVRYWNGVLLQSGTDEVRASEIELQEGETGQRRLAAKGGVSSILYARAGADSANGKPPAPIEGKSREMVYDETKGNIVYTGDAWIRQGDIATRSPVATVSMGEDSSIKALEVGDPVEVEQGVRRATGTHGTYTPGTETMVLVGDKVVLKNPGQEVQGRSLTFRVGDDTILIDGREQVRTETIIRTKESPKP
jgi:lipopolysaccharide transport protein LptA